MKKADLYREWARVLDMCEGTCVHPDTCWKINGTIMYDKQWLNSEPHEYEFAVAILEDKPVFVGDKVYANNCTSPLIVGGISKQKGYIFVGNCINYDISILSLNPPKKTFLLNGVELPCPEKQNEDGYPLSILNDGREYRYLFNSYVNRDKVAEQLIKTLDEAAGK